MTVFKLPMTIPDGAKLSFGERFQFALRKVLPVARREAELGKTDKILRGYVDGRVSVEVVFALARASGIPVRWIVEGVMPDEPATGPTPPQQSPAVLTSPQRAALHAATTNRHQALINERGSWQSGFNAPVPFFDDSVIDQLVSAGLMNRLGDFVVITDRGYDAIGFTAQRRGCAPSPVPITTRQIAAAQGAGVDASTLRRHHHADGSVEFTCSECRTDVFCAIDDGFELPICAECRWHGNVKLLSASR